MDQQTVVPYVMVFIEHALHVNDALGHKRPGGSTVVVRGVQGVLNRQFHCMPVRFQRGVVVGGAMHQRLKIRGTGEPHHVGQLPGIVRALQHKHGRGGDKGEHRRRKHAVAVVGVRRHAVCVGRRVAQAKHGGHRFGVLFVVQGHGGAKPPGVANGTELHHGAGQLRPNEVSMQQDRQAPGGTTVDEDVGRGAHPFVSLQRGQQCNHVGPATVVQQWYIL